MEAKPASLPAVVPTPVEAGAIFSSAKKQSDVLRQAMSEAVATSAKGALEVNDKIIDAMNTQSLAALDLWRSAISPPLCPKPSRRRARRRAKFTRRLPPSGRTSPRPRRSGSPRASSPCNRRCTVRVAKHAIHQRYHALRLGLLGRAFFMSSSPIPAVIAVIIRDDRTLLVRRANPPDAGLWGFPGGKIEFGETVNDAAVRELLEETGVHAEAQDVLTTLDILVRDAGGDVQQHYILIAVQCRWVSGEPVAADDALEARWFAIAELDPDTLAMSVDVDVIARRAQAKASNLGNL